MAAPSGEPEAAPVEFGGNTYKALADGKYDAIILGTGLKECILSGLLSVQGKKVLHLDRNSYYGGESASLNLTNLYKKFVADKDPPEEYFAALGQNRDYNVDLIPKFIMANGILVKLLVRTDVTRYLDFKSIDGSFVYKRVSGGGNVEKVPATEAEALSTGLMGFFQKRKFRNMLLYVAQFDENNPSTHDRSSLGDCKRVTARQFFEDFGLDKNSIDFAGHAMALMAHESYLDQPAIRVVNALKLYAESLARHGVSPFIYPIYGLGGLPEAFSRLCAVHGGTFILNKPVDEILFEDGVAVGVRSGEGDDAEVALAPVIIGDPSYFAADKLEHTGRVIRSICVLDHPVAAVGNVDSAQIIIPQNQIGRHNDVYVSIVSYAHRVAAKNKYIAIVSTTVETNNPPVEVEAGIQLLGSVLQRFDNIVDTYRPKSDGRDDKCFISASYDASSHFETTSLDVIDLYERITGTPLDIASMSIKAEAEA